MKFTLNFKCPDVLDQLTDEPMTNEELAAATKVAKMWLNYSEYIKIEFDTETLTAIVTR